MTIRQEMLQAARRAPSLLRDRRRQVAGFVRGQLNADGGFRDRGGKSDLYYAVFGIEGLAALAEQLPCQAIEAYLRGFGGGEGLDLVHLSCLGRCWAALPADRLAETARREILDRLERCRSSDGGYGRAPGAGRGTPYACFLALGAYQDLQAEVPSPAGLAGCLESLRAADGGYVNDPDCPVGSTPATAAAVTGLRHLGRPADASAAEWLLARAAPDGGFVAAPGLPLPDLLSTATALHALAAVAADVDKVKAACIRFVEGLYCRQGAFRGHLADRNPDCEYTYYGLLALGHLST